MQTITIKIKDKSNSEFLLELLRKLNFTGEIYTFDSTVNLDTADNNDFVLPKGKPETSDFAAMWSSNQKTLEQIRESAWKRS